MSERAARREFPPTGGFVDVDGARLHYVERGAGPAVVLLAETRPQAIVAAVREVRA